MARDENGRFVTEVTYEGDALLAAASQILEYIGSLEPQWKTRIEVAKIERHWNDLQCLAQLAAYTLEQNAHLVAPPHPAFETGYVPTGTETICPGCNNKFITRYPGQPYCSNSCATVARTRQLDLPLEQSKAV